MRLKESRWIYGLRKLGAGTYEGLILNLSPATPLQLGSQVFRIDNAKANFIVVDYYEVKVVIVIGIHTD